MAVATPDNGILSDLPCDVSRLREITLGVNL
jgi:hypothetical protein